MKSTLCRWTCGDVTSVYAAGGQYVQKESDYPDVVLASLNFANGAVGLLHSSHVSAVGGYGGRVDCEGGSIYFPQTWGGDATIQIKPFEDEGRQIKISDIESPTASTRGDSCLCGCDPQRYTATNHRIRRTRRGRNCIGSVPIR